MSKTCKLCNRVIDLKKDDYVRLTDYKNGKLLMEGYYHNACYHAQIQNAVVFNKQKLFERMKEMFPEIGKQLDGVIDDGK